MRPLACELCIEGGKLLALGNCDDLVKLAYSWARLVSRPVILGASGVILLGKRMYDPPPGL